MTSAPLTEGNRGWAVSTTRSIPLALSPGLCCGCAGSPHLVQLLGGILWCPLPWHSPALGYSPGRGGCRDASCSVLPSLPHSPLLWAAFPPQLLPLPSALPSFGTDGARGCGPLAPILMLEGLQGRLRGSWPSREGGTRSKNTIVGSVRRRLLPAPRAGVPAEGIWMPGAQLMLSALPSACRQDCGGHSRTGVGAGLLPDPGPAPTCAHARLTAATEPRSDRLVRPPRCWGRCI